MFSRWAWQRRIKSCAKVLVSSPSPSEFVIFSGVPQKMPFETVDSSTQHLRVGVVRGLISRVEAKALCLAAAPPKPRLYLAEQIKTSVQGFQAGPHIKERHRDLYDRFMMAAWSVDSHLWQRIFSGLRLYPELQYEEHDAGAAAKTIEHDADDASALTAILLLSDPAEFQGSCCYVESDEGQPRKVELRKGDALFFQGDRCAQWFAPLEGGSHSVLRIELGYGRSWGTFVFLAFSIMTTMVSAILVLLGEVHPAFRQGVPMLLLMSGVVMGQGMPPWLQRSYPARAGFMSSHAVLLWLIAWKLPQVLEEW